MTPLVIVGIAVGVLAGVRSVAVRLAERADAARPRGPNGVVVGAEGFRLDRPGAPGVLLLHGGGDTPQTLRELGERLHAAGFAISAPLLPGHGRSVRDFRHVNAQGLHAAALAAYDALRDDRAWTAIVGLSMGGALATLTAAARPDAAALVLLAPYLDLPAHLRFAAALAGAAGVLSPYYPAKDQRSIRDPAARERGLAYGVFTPAALRALRDTADAAAAALPRVAAPTLILQSERDNRVAPEVAIRALGRLGATDKRLEWVSDGGHVITVDYGREKVFALTAEWLRDHGADALLPS
ncbi:MAG: alpha/beta fold hydrolase [Gemmatimonadota bacterium]|nr:alpha/beta fold hydrolase [Gemmatimonadota bacterium]